MENRTSTHMAKIFQNVLSSNAELSELQNTIYNETKRLKIDQLNQIILINLVLTILLFSAENICIYFDRLKYYCLAFYMLS